MRKLLVLIAFALIAFACTDSDPDDGLVTEAAESSNDDISDAGSDSDSDAADDQSDDDESSDGVDTTDESNSTDGSSSNASDGRAVADTPADPIDWSDCDNVECATVTVPIDYADPSLGTLDIAVNVRRAESQDDRLGYLFINPGGPGGSGLEMAANANLFFLADITDRFDVIGFDPRGVGESEPEFGCGEPGEQQALLNQFDGFIDTDEEIALGEEAVALCVETMGTAASFLHTEYVARDMDQIRKALDVEQISFFGASYGSTIGLWYSSLFPDHVRAMVVDGADNPLDDVSSFEARYQSGLEEIQTFEDRLVAALEACNTEDCPIYNDGDPKGYFLNAVDKLDLVSEPFAGDRDAGFLGVLTTLYSEATYPDLWQAMFELQEDDNPDILIDFASLQIEENVGSDTGYINCLDSYVLHPEITRSVQFEDEQPMDARFREDLPFIAAIASVEMGPCAFMDTIAPSPFTGTLDGGDVPVLVIGNPSDPATPFGESVEMAEESLSNGFLVEADHPDHVVYPNNQCVVGHVHTALIDQQLPDSNRVACGREDATVESVTPQLIELCQTVLADFEGQLDDGQADDICDQFVERLLEREGPEVVAQADRSTEAQEAISDVFLEVLLENLG